jgi:ABC-type antimicrobial peptide transport system permease subunit
VVASVSELMDAPFGGRSYAAGISVQGRPADAGEQVYFNFVGPRFFETLGIRLLAGRDFLDSDHERSLPVAVVSRSLAAHYFPGRDPIGERVTAGGQAIEIVGVSSDLPYGSIRSAKEQVVYRPHRQDSSAVGIPTFAIRTHLGTEEAARLIRATVHEIAPAVPVHSITTLEAGFRASIARERLLANISTFFGVIALVLVGMGVFAAVADTVTQRRREMALRLTLGGTRLHVVALTVRGTLFPLGIGLLTGLPLAYVAGQAARGALFGITSSDPLTYLGSLLCVAAVAMVAAFRPVRAVFQTDPATTLRLE